MKKLKTLKLSDYFKPGCVALITCLLFSCATKSTNEEERLMDSTEIISEKTVDSLLEKGIAPERRNVQARMGEEVFISKGFAVNTYMINSKKTFSIYTTDNESQITVNYSGPQKPGVYIAGEFLQAGLRQVAGETYQAVAGQVEFAGFDTIAKKLSGTFSFRFENIKDKSDIKFIDQGKFHDLTWTDPEPLQ